MSRTIYDQYNRMMLSKHLSGYDKKINGYSQVYSQKKYDKNIAFNSFSKGISKKKLITISP